MCDVITKILTSLKRKRIIAHARICERIPEPSGVVYYILLTLSK